jgi:hypothetical protein
MGIISLLGTVMDTKLIWTFEQIQLGQKSKTGDIIGYVGSTGRSEGPHLHYEVHKDGKVVNPLNFYLWKHFSRICCHFKVSKPRKSIIRLMHIELQPDKRYYSIGEIAKAFDKRIPYPFLGQ